MKYAKLIDGQLQFAPKNNGSVLNYDTNIELMIADGYKQFISAERPETNRLYHIVYVESVDAITETIKYDETQKEADTREAAERKTSFNSQFLETSLGWYRLVPKGYSNAQQSIDVINNHVNALGSFTSDLAEMTIFYEQPDFTDPEQCTEEWLVQHQKHPEPMSKEAWTEFYFEFSRLYAKKQYQPL